MTAATTEQSTTGSGATVAGEPGTDSNIKDDTLCCLQESGTYFESLGDDEESASAGGPVEPFLFGGEGSMYLRPLLRDLASSAGSNSWLPYPQFLTTISETIIPAGLESGDATEVCAALKMLSCPQYFDAFVYRAVRLSLDLSLDKQRWLSELITILYDRNIVTRQGVGRGFEKLVQQIEDVALDVPGAHFLVLSFIQCAVDDKVLDPAFVARLPESFLLGLLPDDLRAVPDACRLTEEQQGELRKHLQQLRRYKQSIAQYITTEFLVSGDAKELGRYLEEIGSPEFRHEVIRAMLKASMGKTNEARLFVSDAISGLYSKVFKADDIFVGFVRVLGEVEDLHIDIPAASSYLVKFIVRALVDEVIPPSCVLDSMRLRLGGDEGKSIMRTVKEWALDEQKCTVNATKFREIWKLNDPESPQFVQLKRAIKKLVQDHFADRDFTATLKQFEALLTPDHQPLFVEMTIRAALEDSAKLKPCVELLESLSHKTVLDPDAIIVGFTNAKKKLYDIQIDNPNAPELYQKIVIGAKQAHALPADFLTISSCKND